jgi:ApaG protein
MAKESSVKPVLKPGELHTYSSGLLIVIPYGAMKGYFNMINLRANF